MVSVAQNFETTNAIAVGVQVMMAPWPVTCAVAWVDVVNFAIAPLG